jgi:1-acyl-sn-glycerol-3-phosphate acyltransferase
MIPARKNDLYSKLFIRYVRWWMGRNFKEINVFHVEPRPGHSVLLLCNHFSWWDGFIANYVCVYKLKRRFFIMIKQENFLKHGYFKFIGAFAVKKGSREMLQSLTYSAGLLDDPKNAVVIYPQGELCSNHVADVLIEKGIDRLIKQIKNPCQVIYQCTLIDYFESLKPRAYVHQFDCGVAGEVPFEELKQRINDFHKQALKNQVNVHH